jgi:hypothetical protein
MNGTRGTLVASTSALASEFQWCWSSGVLYIWSSTDTDPSGYYTAPGIEAGDRSRVIDTNNQSYVTLTGLTLRDANGLDDGMINIGSASVVGIVFKNATVERAVDTAFNSKGTSLASSLTINNCVIQNNGGYAIAVSTEYRGSAAFSNNVITGNGWGSIRDSQEYSAISGYLGNANDFGNTIYANDPVCANAGQVGNFCHGVYAVGSISAANIFNNTIFSMPTGAGVKAIGTANIYGNLIYNNGTNGIQLGENGSTPVTYSVHNNTIYGNNVTDTASAGIAEHAKGTGALYLSVYGNTLYNNGNTTGYELAIADTVTTLTIEDNIMFASPTRRTLGLMQALTQPVSIDYNIYYRYDGNPNIAYNSTYLTWKQWLSATSGFGVDTHSLNLDPLFASAGAGNFDLTAGSPAINTGVSIGGTGTGFVNIGAH